MLRPETARQLKEAGLVWRPQPGDAFMPGEDFGEEVFVTDGSRDPESDDVWLPDVETMVREVNARGWLLLITVSPHESYLKIYNMKGSTAEMTGRPEEFADLVGRALLFVLNMERGKGKK